MRKAIVGFGLGLVAVLSSASVFASGNNPVSKACLRVALMDVNRHHCLAEGSVYAVRVLYSGRFGATLLVGHSDETDATDYLVNVKFNRQSCTVVNRTLANEASEVEEYSDAEKLDQLFSPVEINAIKATACLGE